MLIWKQLFKKTAPQVTLTGESEWVSERRSRARSEPLDMSQLAARELFHFSISASSVFPEHFHGCHVQQIAASTRNNRNWNTWDVNLQRVRDPTIAPRKEQPRVSRRVTGAEKWGVKMEIRIKWRQIESCYLWFANEFTFSIIYWKNLPGLD